MGPSPAAAASAEDRYALAGGCFALKSEATGRFVARAQGGAWTATVGSAGAERFRMQATDLGRYLFFGEERDFLTGARSTNGVGAEPEPSNPADWTVRKPGSVFTVSNRFIDRDLSVNGDGELRTAPAGGAGRSGEFSFVPAGGCAVYPEITTNVRGAPSRAFPRYGETEGLLEGHMHHMAFKFLGGAHCGRPWHKFGVPYALVDCPDHEPNGCTAVLDSFLSGEQPPCHDTTGWPDFTDWPSYNSLTHEQSYYKWLERANQAGLRIFVNLMVQNRVLCEIYPINPENQECDDTKTVDIELREAYKLQDYIDAQAGGPGEGFYRIVTNPFQARRVINQGKLAVVLGMEVSEPFGCRMWMGVATCDQQQITNQLDKLHAKGVRQLEITNKFDNALTGVAGDNGTTGTLVNSGNFYATGRWWDMETCEEGEDSDRHPTGVELHNDDVILANIIQEYIPGGIAPVYPEGPLCNQRGLTELGEHAIREIVRRDMIFDPDHMSVKGRDAALNLVESLDYSGIISSHSWSTPSALPRIYRLGGVITPYAGNSESFVEAWQHLDEDYSGRQYFGVGYGADQNGFGSQGAPRGADAPNPVRYPFRSFDGKQLVGKQRSGNRTYDINVDGVAHYGLYPDWIEDLRQLAGDRIIEDLSRGSEAYLQMWERAVGVREVRCPAWRGSFNRRGLARKVRLGDSPKRALKRTGQPLTRERVWQWCTRASRNGKRQVGTRRRVAGVFSPGGRLRLVASSLRRNDAGGIQKGDPDAKVARLAQPLGGGIWTRPAGGGSVYVYGSKGGRVRFTGVADRSLARSPRALRAYSRGTGLT